MSNFVISLDFELYWGIADVVSLDKRKDYFLKTRAVIPDILSVFEKNKIHATWATVGFLFAKNKQQLLDFLPEEQPSYDNQKLNYYSLIKTIGNSEDDDPFHYAYSLIKKIINTPYQELASHTFAHYYCNAAGQTPQQFDLDLKAAQAISKENFGKTLQSLVFPRNNFNESYLAIAYNNQIKVVRSNPEIWFWNKSRSINKYARAIDTLLPVFPSLSFDFTPNANAINALPASRFLRAYQPSERILHSLVLNRIKKEMTYAAKNNKTYHLWWHPHNFGFAPSENMTMLKSIAKHFNELNHKYNFQSKTMIEMLNN